MVFTFGPEHSGICHDIERTGEGIFKAPDCLLESTMGVHHKIMDLWVARLERYLDMIQASFYQAVYILGIRQATGIGIQAGDLTVALGVSDQFGQVFAQGRLAAGEDDMRDAQFQALSIIRFQEEVESSLTLAPSRWERGKRKGRMFDVVAMGAIVVAAIGERQVSR